MKQMKQIAPAPEMLEACRIGLQYNARLIAAAPTMLTALRCSLVEHQGVLGFLMERGERGECVARWTQATREIIDVVTQAIKKAEGEV